MIVIDGSRGEGGGQVLRSSLSLSLITGKPFRIEKIRAGRAKPGLMRQHLTAVQAAAAISGGEVSGAELRSGEVTFTPGETRAGDHSFAIGSAGSTSLVLQTILPALARASGPSTVELRGGTHNPLAPSFDYLVRAVFPLLARMGPRVEATLHRPGFYPGGGGHVTYSITPAATLTPLSLETRGAIRRREIVAGVASLASNIGAREITTIAEELGWDRGCGRVERIDNAMGPGNVVSAIVESENVTEVFTGFGEKGVRAEALARDVAREAAAYIDADVPVGQHLADQLLLWLALAGSGSFRTLEPTGHTRTQLEVLATFLDVSIACAPGADGAWRVSVES